MIQMSTSPISPIAGQWYETRKGQIFLVVALDETSSMIELQHQNGDLNEIDLEEWAQLDLEVVEAPSDWVGSLDSTGEEEP